MVKVNRPIKHWVNIFTLSISALFRRSTVSLTNSNVFDMRAVGSLSIG